MVVRLFFPSCMCNRLTYHRAECELPNPVFGRAHTRFFALIFCSQPTQIRCVERAFVNKCGSRNFAAPNQKCVRAWDNIFQMVWITEIVHEFLPFMPSKKKNRTKTGVHYENSLALPLFYAFHTRNARFVFSTLSYTLPLPIFFLFLNSAICAVIFTLCVDFRCFLPIFINKMCGRFSGSVWMYCNCRQKVFLLLENKFRYCCGNLWSAESWDGEAPTIELQQNDGNKWENEKLPPSAPETDEVSEIFMVAKISKNLAFQSGSIDVQRQQRRRRRRWIENKVMNGLFVTVSAALNQHQFNLSTHFELIDNEMALWHSLSFCCDGIGTGDVPALKLALK